MKILITVPFTEEQEKRLRAQMPGAEYEFTTKIKASDEQIREADVILGNLPVARLAKAENLKWLQLNSSGADAYAAEGALAPEVVLTNATGAYGLAISEHLLAATCLRQQDAGDRTWQYRRRLRPQDGAPWKQSHRDQTHQSGMPGLSGGDRNF